MLAQPLIFHPAASATVAAVWPVEAVLALFDLPFNDLLFRAQQIHHAHFDPTEVELVTLLSIKIGGYSEDCGYCPQAVRYDTGVVAKNSTAGHRAGSAASSQGAWRYPVLHGVSRKTEI